jgi:hypothetical protein
VAGGSSLNDVDACTLRPLRRDELPVGFTDAQWDQMQAIFGTGVCDWSQPGVGQQPTIPWLTYQDVGGAVVYGGRPLGPPPASVATTGAGTLPATRGTAGTAALGLIALALVAVAAAKPRTRPRSPN